MSKLSEERESESSVSQAPVESTEAQAPVESRLRHGLRHGLGHRQGHGQGRRRAARQEHSSHQAQQEHTLKEEELIGG